MVDDRTPAWPVGWTALFILINRLLGGASIIVCIGAEHLRRPLARSIVRHVYSLARICTCRDEASAEVLIEAGVRREKVRVTRDVVFSLDPSVLPSLRSLQTGLTRKVALPVAFDPNRIRENSDRSALLAAALLEKGISVVLVAHDLRPEYDKVAIDEIMARFPGHLQISVFRGARLADVLKLYSECDAVISGRMHPLILASLIGTLPIAFGGKEKIRSLLRISSIPALAEGTPQEQTAQAIDFIARRDEILRQLVQQVAGFRTVVEQSIADAVALYGPAPAPGSDTLRVSP